MTIVLASASPRRRELLEMLAGTCELLVSPAVSTESAKVSVRNARRNAIEKLKKSIKDGVPEDVEKDAEEQCQKLHDKYIKKIDGMLEEKNKEIMTV